MLDVGSEIGARLELGGQVYSLELGSRVYILAKVRGELGLWSELGLTVRVRVG